VGQRLSFIKLLSLLFYADFQNAIQMKCVLLDQVLPVGSLRWGVAARWNFSKGAKAQLYCGLSPPIIWFIDGTIPELSIRSVGPGGSPAGASPGNAALVRNQLICEPARGCRHLCVVAPTYGLLLRHDQSLTCARDRLAFDCARRRNSWRFPCGKHLLPAPPC
jgi:hypothetical protein